MNNNYRMAKIDKKAVEQARSTPEEENAQTKKRLDQLIVKKYVRAIIGPDDVSDSEDGDRELLEKSDMPRKDQIMRHKGNMPRKKEEDSN